MRREHFDDPLSMQAIVITGNGGCEKLEYKRVPKPVAGPRAVLLKVLSAGVNNTDINTRLGWYSTSVTRGPGAIGHTEINR